MRQILGNLRRTFARVFADRLLQMLILSVVAVAFFCAFVLQADASLVFGLLAIGIVTALMESTAHRNRR